MFGDVGSIEGNEDMRMPRLKISGRSAVYHCIARVVGGQFLLRDEEKEKLRLLLWEYAEFCGVEIVTYCVMSNHFHVLVRVPEEVVLSDVELVEKARRFYGKKSPLVQSMQKHFEKHGQVPDDLRESLMGRMADVSTFMKEVKQRFSKWYNKQTNRFGTMWAERFKSVLVEDTVDTVSTVAMYVDLNPVRAGLVKDPKDYRFCGYAEAVAGNQLARAGIIGFHQADDWRKVAIAYRKALIVVSATANHSDKVPVDREAIQAELDRGAELSRGQVLRLRVRYMTDGMVLGSKNYVNEIFTEYRDRFGPKRKTGARKLREVGDSLGLLTSARDLRKSVVS
jgi:REP element-mobilizing transposase RayT